MIIKRLFRVLDKTKNKHHMEQFKILFKAIEKLIVSLFIINLYVNTVVKFYYKFYQFSLNDCFLVYSMNFIKLP